MAEQIESLFVDYLYGKKFTAYAVNCWNPDISIGEIFIINKDGGQLNIKGHRMIRCKVVKRKIS